MSTPFFSLVMGRIDNLQFEQLVGARKAKFSAPSSRPAYRTISIVNSKINRPYRLGLILVAGKVYLIILSLFFSSLPESYASLL